MEFLRLCEYSRETQWRESLSTNNMLRSHRRPLAHRTQMGNRVDMSSSYVFNGNRHRDGLCFVFVASANWERLVARIREVNVGGEVYSFDTSQSCKTWGSCFSDGFCD